jgi:hypothetical protein
MPMSGRDYVRAREPGRPDAQTPKFQLTDEQVADAVAKLSPREVLRIVERVMRTRG